MFNFLAGEEAFASAWEAGKKMTTQTVTGHTLPVTVVEEQGLTMSLLYT